MDLADVIAPAIKLAEEGFIPDLHVALHTAISCQELAAFPSTARTYLRDGNYVYRTSVVNDGDIFRQPDLARSLRLLAKEGPSAFYTGAIAQAIHEEMAATGGMLTRDDLARYAPRVLPALTGTYRGLELAFSPGATGGATALEMLNILAQFPKSRTTWKIPGGLHLRAEAIRRAFLDRFEHLGDPERVKAPWDALLARAYAAKVAAASTEGPAQHPSRPDPWRYETTARAADCTTHLCAVDRQRNMVSLTNTAVSLWDLAWSFPDGHPAPERHGLVRSRAGTRQSVAPGKRPLVNMVPALAFKRGLPTLPWAPRAGGRSSRRSPGDREHGRPRRLAPGGHRGATAAHGRRRALVDDRVGTTSLAALTRMVTP